MPDILASCKPGLARHAGAQDAVESGNFGRMPKKPPGPLQIAVSARLAAVQEELNKSDAAMGKMLGCGRTTWGNWIHQQNMPEEGAMIRLCEMMGLSMEWIYRGIAATMPVRLFIRLELRLVGIDPDIATPEQVAPVAARAAALVAP
jgi:hypothetical protein